MCARQLGENCPTLPCFAAVWGSSEVSVLRVQMFSSFTFLLFSFVTSHPPNAVFVRTVNYYYSVVRKSGLIRKFSFGKPNIECKNVQKYVGDVYVLCLYLDNNADGT